MPNIIVIMPSVSSARQHMAARLGFESVSELDKWEEDIAIDHFANFICDYLAHGYTVQPDMRELVDYIDLEKAVAERINMLEQRRFEQVLDPDKSEWTVRDHYKQFVIGVVSDDLWLSMYDIEGAVIAKRGWTAKMTTVKMVRYLEFLIREWKEEAGNTEYGEKTRRGGQPGSRRRN